MEKKKQIIDQWKIGRDMRRFFPFKEKKIFYLFSNINLPSSRIFGWWIDVSTRAVLVDRLDIYPEIWLNGADIGNIRLIKILLFDVAEHSLSNSEWSMINLTGELPVKLNPWSLLSSVDARLDKLETKIISYIHVHNMLEFCFY
jgi:hypothetical protein